MSHLIRADLPEPSPPTTKRLTTSSPRVLICSSGFCHISHLLIWVLIICLILPSCFDHISHLVIWVVLKYQLLLTGHPIPRQQQWWADAKKSSKQKFSSNYSPLLAAVSALSPVCGDSGVTQRDREGKAHIHPHTQTQMRAAHSKKHGHIVWKEN